VGEQISPSADCREVIKRLRSPKEKIEDISILLNNDQLHDA